MGATTRQGLNVLFPETNPPVCCGDRVDRGTRQGSYVCLLTFWNLSMRRELRCPVGCWVDSHLSPLFGAPYLNLALRYFHCCLKDWDRRFPLSTNLCSAGREGRTPPKALAPRAGRDLSADCPPIPLQSRASPCRHLCPKCSVSGFTG